MRDAHARSAGARALTALIYLYRGARAWRSPACRFIPSCSEYALEALATHSVKGALCLIAGRLARCRPGGPFGYDPVPVPVPRALEKSTSP